MSFRFRNLAGYAVAVIAAGTLAVAGSMTVLADTPTCTEGQTPAADNCQLPPGDATGGGAAGDTGATAGGDTGAGTTEGEGGTPPAGDPDPGAGSGGDTGTTDGDTGGGDTTGGDTSGGDGTTTDPGTDTGGDTGTTGGDTGGGDTTGGDTSGGDGTTTDGGGDTTTTDTTPVTTHKPHRHHTTHRHHRHHAVKKPSRSQQRAATTIALHNHAFVPPTTDARLFREQYTPEGQIPEMKTPLAPATAATFRAATTAAGGSWALLAAVSWNESEWGTSGSGPLAGARLTPGQWTSYGTDGDGDGSVSHASEADTLATLSALLADQPAWQKGTHPAETPLTSYYGNADTAERVALLADFYDAMGTDALEKGLDDADVRDALAARVLDDKRVTIYDGGRSDIDAKLIDPRVLVLVEFLANRVGSISVSCLVSGHSVFTASGNVSLHSFGQAVDIGSLQGEVINASSQQGTDSVTVHALKDVLRLPEKMQPYELISLWTLGGPSFALADHDDHIHAGFKTEPESTPAP